MLKITVWNFRPCTASTVKPVLRGHIWDKEKVAYKTGDLLKEVQFIWQFLWQVKKRWYFNKGDRMDRFDCTYLLRYRNNHELLSPISTFCCAIILQTNVNLTTSIITCLIAPNNLNMIWLSNLLTWILSDECYSRFISFYFWHLDDTSAGRLLVSAVQYTILRHLYALFDISIFAIYS